MEEHIPYVLAETPPRGSIHRGIHPRKTIGRRLFPDMRKEKGCELIISSQRSQLGKYAHEDQMPDRLVSLLEKGEMVKSEGMPA